MTDRERQIAIAAMVEIKRLEIQIRNLRRWLDRQQLEGVQIEPAPPPRSVKPKRHFIGDLPQLV